jgi:hypothetical protein
MRRSTDGIFCSRSPVRGSFCEFDNEPVSGAVAMRFKVRTVAWVRHLNIKTLRLFHDEG